VREKSGEREEERREIVNKILKEKTIVKNLMFL